MSGDLFFSLFLLTLLVFAHIFFFSLIVRKILRKINFKDFVTLFNFSILFFIYSIFSYVSILVMCFITPELFSDTAVVAGCFLCETFLILYVYFLLFGDVVDDEKALLTLIDLKRERRKKYIENKKIVRLSIYFVFIGAIIYYIATTVYKLYGIDTLQLSFFFSIYLMCIVIFVSILSIKDKRLMQ